MNSQEIEQDIKDFLAKQQAKQLEVANKIKVGLTIFGVGLAVVAVAAAVVVVAVVTTKKEEIEPSVTYWTQVPESEIIK